MKESFPIKHWFFTLIAGPVLSPFYNYFFSQDENLFSGLLELYPIALALSALLSLPGLLLDYGVFYSLKNLAVNLKVSKIILITFPVLTIIVITTLMKGSQSKEIAFCYAIAAIISGCFLQLSKYKSIKASIHVAETL